MLKLRSLIFISAPVTEFRKECLTRIKTCLLLVFSPFLLTAQEDTVLHTSLEGFVDGTVFSGRTYFNPVEDTIYYRSDSSLFSGVLHVKYLDRSCPSKKPGTLIQESWYKVREGVPALNRAVNYFVDCEKQERGNIISAESFVSDTLVRYITYRTNGKPWHFETQWIEPGDEVISETKMVNNEGTLIYDIHRLNGYMHGCSQIIVSTGDTLSLLYQTGHLSDVLTKDVWFLSANGKRISKAEFLVPEKDWSHSWSFAVIRQRKKPILVLYQVDPAKCEYRLLQENNCIPRSGNKRSFRRKLLKKNINPYADYLNNSFEGTFKRREKAIRKYIDTVRSFTNNISMGFGSDSSYYIMMEVPRLEQGGITKQDLHYHGKYTFDEQGALILLGDHPYESNILQIRESVNKGYMDVWGFTVRLKEELKWISNRKVYLSCDGGCGYEY